MAAISRPLTRHGRAAAGTSSGGVVGWLSTVDHKRIGIMYIATSVVFFLVGGIESLLMRSQLAIPQNNLLGPDVYDQVFTLHGVTMIFFVVMPWLFGFANFLLPLMIGARDVAYPRLNAFSYWLLPASGLLLYFSCWPDRGSPFCLTHAGPGKSGWECFRLPTDGSSDYCLLARRRH